MAEANKNPGFTGITVALLLLLFLSMPVSVPVKAAEPADSTHPGGAEPEYTDFIGKRFAVTNGSVYIEFSEDVMKASEKIIFDDYPSIYEAILKGKADAGMRGYYSALASLHDQSNTDLAVIKLPEGIFDLMFGAISTDQNIIDSFNGFLAAIKDDDTYDEIKARWLDDPGVIPVMPDIPSTGENGTLIVAISSDYRPFSFIDSSGSYTGFDIELVLRFAAYMGMNTEFINMPFSGLLPYVISGKADIGISDIFITEERRKSVLFTDPYITDYTAIIYRRDIFAGGSNEEPALSYTDFAGKKIGVMTGSIRDDIIKDVVLAEPVYYADDSTGIEDVRQGRIDGVVITEGVMHVLAAMEGNENFIFVEIPPQFYNKSVLFTDSVLDEGSETMYILTIQEQSALMRGGFLETLKTGIERNLITDNRWKLVLNGLGVTMTIAALSQLSGTVFGCFICYLLTRKNKFIRGIGNFYSGFIHGTPVVVLLMITYYIIFGSTQISNVFIAVAAFTMVTGAGIAVNLKGAIDTVDPVEIEAARSMGFTAFGAFITVTLPQALRRALPGYTNGFVELVKGTAIVGYIAIQDLTRAADIIRSRTYDAFFPLLLVAVIYLIVTILCTQVFRLIVNKINKGVAQVLHAFSS